MSKVIEKITVVEMSRNDLLDAIEPIIYASFLAMAEGFFKGDGTTIESVGDYGNWREKADNDELIEMWTDIFSDKYFIENPEVYAILFLCPNCHKWLRNKQ